jgi:hypothetical protein
VVYVYNRQFQAAATASVIKNVRCERCDCAFQYRLVRRGEGVGNAVYGIGSGWASERASRRAQESLDEGLAKGVDPVPCPDCGWFQSVMVEEWRGRHFRWIIAAERILAILGIGAIGLTLPPLLSDVADKRPRQPMPTSFWVLIAAMSAATLIVGTMSKWLVPRLRRRIDLNASFPEKPKAIPGMPVAVKPDDVLQADEAVEQEFSTDKGPLSYVRPRPNAPGGWTAVQIMHMRMPAMCCSCLQPTEETEAYHPIGKQVDVRVPLCHPCADRFWRMRILWRLGLILFFAAALSPMFIGSGKGPGAWCLGAAIGAMFGGMMGEMVPWMVRPVALRRFSSELNTLEIRFRNPIYNNAFADENRTSG